MTEWAWIVLVLLTAAWLEVLLGAYSVAAPFFISTVFYLLMVFDWRRVVWPALVFALMLDSVQGRVMPAAGLGLGLAWGLACWWKPRDNLTGYLAQAAPNFALGLGYGLLVAFGDLMVAAGWRGLLTAVPWVALRGGVATAVVGVVVCRVLDAVAIRAELPGLLSNQPGETG